MVPTAAVERNRPSRCRCGRGGRMRAGALVSPCHVMAGLVPAIHVFARSSTDLAERDARNKSGHDEGSGRTGETARLTQSHANFRIGTLARPSNQGCGLRGDFRPHREGNCCALPAGGGNGLAQTRRAGPRLDGRRPARQLNPRPALLRDTVPLNGARPRPERTVSGGDYLRAPKAPMRRPTESNWALNVPATPSGVWPA